MITAHAYSDENRKYYHVDDVEQRDGGWFAKDGGAPLPPEDPMLGDIAIAYETCVQEANEAGKPLDAHVRHLIVHATLHLLGYDHVRDADAARMERLESAIVMSAFADPDPYSAA